MNLSRRRPRRSSTVSVRWHIALAMSMWNGRTSSGRLGTTAISSSTCDSAISSISSSVAPTASNAPFVRHAAIFKVARAPWKRMKRAADASGAAHPMAARAKLVRSSSTSGGVGIAWTRDPGLDLERHRHLEDVADRGVCAVEMRVADLRPRRSPARRSARGCHSDATARPRAPRVACSASGPDDRSRGAVACRTGTRRSRSDRRARPRPRPHR